MKLTNTRAENCQLYVFWNFLFLLFQGQLLGPLIPELECWSCDICVGRLPAEGTPVQKSVGVTP
jgi:hypothetical protein